MTVRTPVQQARRTLLYVTLAAFGVAALLGLYRLITDSWNDTLGKITVTLIVLGIASLAAVLVLGERRLAPRWLVVLAIVAILIATVVWLLQTWIDFEWSESPWSAWRIMNKIQVVSTIVVAWSVHAIIMLRDVRFVRPWIRVVLWIVLAGAAVLAGYLLWMELTEYYSTPDLLDRFMAGAGIITGLGTVTLPIARRLIASRDGEAGAASAAQESTPAAVDPIAASLDPQLLADLDARARAEGISPSELLARLLSQ